ncbi:hypothetical protein BKA56DRAFT_622945 [Ilyonectria sp. MPI-CAGE-AT-0026]|nr:hypothetical protein BKA56DRAFT_622945 [Ilyonectria sp. MPI-CAGE-AT-0026]
MPGELNSISNRRSDFWAAGQTQSKDKRTGRVDYTIIYNSTEYLVKLKLYRHSNRILDFGLLAANTQVALVLAAACGNLGIGTAYPIVSAEIPSTTLRAKSLGIGFMVNAFMTWVFALCVPCMFNADAGNLGGKIGFVFAASCAIGFGLAWLEIPETKDLIYAQIDDLSKQGTPTRQSKN